MADVISTHAELARIGIDGWTRVYGKDTPAAYKALGFKPMMTTQEFERLRQEGGLPYATVVNEAGSIPVVSFNTGNQKDYYWVKRGLGYKTTFEKLETDQYKIVAKTVSEKMAIAMNKTKEATAANVFNNATSTSTPYVGPDGLALVSASHTYDGGTWSNYGVGTSNSAVDLGYQALEDALAKIHDTVDEQGIPMDIVGPFDLIVPNELVGLANRVVKSMKVAESANNDMNYAGSFIRNVVRNPWLTDPDAWFLRSVRDDENPLMMLTHGSRRVQKKLYEETEEVAWFMTEKWLFHHRDARGVWGSPGA